ncbi:Palmitoyltransferase [Aphelenchoides fujianensis]|nr:Palmitoyltransferase [Aphelenchoides fujianensis]
MDYSQEARLRSVNDVVRETKKYANRLQPQDIISITCISVLLPLGYLIQVFYVLSFFWETFSDSWYLRALNVYLNIFMLIRVGANGRSAPLPTVMKAGFRYCHSCHLNAPPRAYHCPVCDKCIFRRDHHCSFAATCVGHFNQRVAAIVNLWLVLAIAVCWNWSFVALSLPRFQGLQLWQMFMPHVALLAGFLTLGQFLSVLFFMSSFFRPPTRMEYLMDIFAYNNGLWENVRQALGTRWPLVFVSPFIPSPLPSDGISFKAFDSEDVSKSMKVL